MREFCSAWERSLVELDGPVGPHARRGFFGRVLVCGPQSRSQTRATVLRLPSRRSKACARVVRRMNFQ